MDATRSPESLRTEVVAAQAHSNPFQAVMSFADAYGSLASVASLLITVVGLGVTLWRGSRLDPTIVRGGKRGSGPGCFAIGRRSARKCEAGKTVEPPEDEKEDDVLS